MNRSKLYMEYLNGLVGDDRSDERWVIKGRNRWSGCANYGVMLKRYDREAFDKGMKEWFSKVREAQP